MVRLRGSMLVMLGVLLAAAWMIVGAQSSGAACEGDQLEAVRELGLIYIDALNAGDLDSWYAVLADDYTAYYPEVNFAPMDKDTARTSDEALMAAFPGFQTEIHMSTVSADCRYVTFQWTSIGNFAANGNAVEVPGMTIVEVADGQIVSERVSYDQYLLLTQMGVIGGGTVTEEMAMAFAERFDAIFDGGDVDIADEIFSPDFVAHLPLAPELDRDGWKAYAASFYVGIPDLTEEINEVIVSEDRVVLNVTYTGTHDGPLFGIPATGNPVTIEGIGIFSFDENGLATENWAVIDVVGLLAQIGAFPPAQ